MYAVFIRLLDARTLALATLDEGRIRIALGLLGHPASRNARCQSQTRGICCLTGTLTRTNE